MSKPISARGRWGVQYQAHNAPGFTIILSGEAWIAFEGREPQRLVEGDFLLLPTTPAFSLCSAPASLGRTTRFGRLIDLLAEECAADYPGKELIVQRMLETLLVEALRWHGLDGEKVPTGLPKGLQDPALARVLRAVHADVRESWTVAEIARIAGMSRSAFAARFVEIIGCAPIKYLARWRMALAKNALARGTKSLDRIASEIG